MKTSHINASNFDYSSRPVYEGEQQLEADERNVSLLYAANTIETEQQQQQQQRRVNYQQQTINDRVQPNAASLSEQNLPLTASSFSSSKIRYTSSTANSKYQQQPPPRSSTLQKSSSSSIKRKREDALMMILQCISSDERRRRGMQLVGQNNKQK
ncbi:hypothetical protein GQX74_003818, partial [Glossina fuscipes]